MKTFYFLALMLLPGVRGGFAYLGGDCSDAECLPDEGFCDTESNLCSLKAGESCAGNADKCLTGGECDATDNLCQCKDGYVKSTESTCLIQADGDCSSQPTKCHPDTTCKDNTCQCNEGFTASSKDKICVIPADGDCSSQPTRCGPDSTCKDNKCQCNEGFTASSKDKICEKGEEGSANVLAISVSALVLTVIAGRIAWA